MKSISNHWSPQVPSLDCFSWKKTLKGTTLWDPHFFLHKTAGILEGSNTKRWSCGLTLGELLTVAFSVCVNCQALKWPHGKLFGRESSSNRKEKDSVGWHVFVVGTHMVYHDLASLTECPEDGWVKYLCFTSPKRKCSKGNGAQDVQVIDETVDFGSLFDGGQLPTLIPMWGGLGVRLKIIVPRPGCAASWCCGGRDGQDLVSGVVQWKLQSSVMIVFVNRNIPELRYVLYIV